MLAAVMAALFRPALAALPALLLLAACAGGGRPDAGEGAPVPRTWQAYATRADRDRLRDWRMAWNRALAAARAAGHGPEIAAQGALLVPDAALPDPAPPPGDYACRMTKLGARRPGLLDYVAYPAFRCEVQSEGGRLSLTKLTGSQRPTGALFPDSVGRMVFIGTMILSEERTAQAYGRDPDRDMIGVVERIGPRRWRLVLPSPRWESLLDVLELVPA